VVHLQAQFIFQHQGRNATSVRMTEYQNCSTRSFPILDSDTVLSPLFLDDDFSPSPTSDVDDTARDNPNFLQYFLNWNRSTTVVQIWVYH